MTAGPTACVSPVWRVHVPRTRAAGRRPSRWLAVFCLARRPGFFLRRPRSPRRSLPERLLHAADEPQNWLMNLGAYDGSRYSGLASINRENVGRLVVRYSVPLGGLLDGGGNFRDALPLSPLVEDGFIYIVDSWGEVSKLDAERTAPSSGRTTPASTISIPGCSRAGASRSTGISSSRRPPTAGCTGSTRNRAISSAPCRSATLPKATRSPLPRSWSATASSSAAADRTVARAAGSTPLTV